MSGVRGTPLMSFLPLGPVTSESFPKSQQSQQEAKPAAAAAAATTTSAAEESTSNATTEHHRRSSSLSSDGKSAYRVLKVAPVHFGEHAGDHKEDFHEVEVAVE